MKDLAGVICGALIVHVAVRGVRAWRFLSRLADTADADRETALINAAIQAQQWELMRPWRWEANILSSPDPHNI